MTAKMTTPEQAEAFHMAQWGRPECFPDCCLCRVERERDEARRQLAEAAACVRGLIALARANEAHWDAETPAEEVLALDECDEAWDALPAWLRREIEK